MSIISISGKIGTGKDTVAAMIQYLIWKDKVEKGEKFNLHYTFKDFTNSKFGGNTLSNWEIKKFADKLKDIVCLLIGCTREQLEDRDFKEKELGEEWWYWYMEHPGGYSPTMLDYLNTSKKQLSYYKGLKLIKLTPRLLMQLLGTDCGRKILPPNIWVNSLMAEYKESLPHTKDLFNVPEVEAPDAKETTWIKDQCPNWIISDTRFPNELKAVKDRNGIVIRITRPDFVENALTGEKFPVKVYRQEHESEIALDNSEFDYEILNDGTIADLRDKVYAILKQEQIIS